MDTTCVTTETNLSQPMIGNFDKNALPKFAMPLEPANASRRMFVGQMPIRLFGMVFGFGNQLLFIFTVWYLFWFLRDGAIYESHGHWLFRDCALLLIFAVSHSVMLVPRTRRFLTRWIPAAFYDSTFCIVTCVSLLLLFFGWRTSQTVLWQATGLVESIIRASFYMSWLALVYSLALTGLGYQNGWTPFYYWLCGQKAPRREFKPRGAYKLIRHPVYLSFLALIWFTPRMSLDHAALTAIWTAYIFYGSFLKDRRLEYYIGKPYQVYASQVPGYPLMSNGPLGLQLPSTQASQAASQRGY